MKIKLSIAFVLIAIFPLEAKAAPAKCQTVVVVTRNLIEHVSSTLQDPSQPNWGIERQWSERVRQKYGLAWANFSNARNPSVSCKKIPNLPDAVVCIARGQPCRVLTKN